jgi:hypothetical protein
VANAGSDDLSILLGGGEGIFSLKVRERVGKEPEAVVVGYLNDDGCLDIAVANSGSDNVSIMLGRCDGTFIRTDVKVGERPGDVSVSDFNDDGCLDIAVANSGSDNVSVLLGEKDRECEGTFEVKSIEVGERPSAVAVGDFNDDGKPDLAVTRMVNTGLENVSVMLGEGDGTFERPKNFGSGGLLPNAIVVGDFNRDGRLDLAVANSGSDNICLMLGKGDGTFAGCSDE